MSLARQVREDELRRMAKDRRNELWELFRSRMRLPLNVVGPVGADMVQEILKLEFGE